MNRLLIAALLLTAALTAVAATPAAGDYIVSFDEPPLAAFRGFDGDSDPKRAGLKATSPAVTGAPRLDLSSLAARDYRAWLAEQRDQRLQAISGVLGRTLKPSMTLDVVNNAAVLRLSAEEAQRVAGLPGVAFVEREFTRRMLTDAGPGWIGADEVWAGVDGVANRGEGVVVGVIDSGINRTHPAFAGVGPLDGFVHVNPRGRLFGLCAGTPTLCNSKLIGIHDFTLCTGVHASSSCVDSESNTGLDPDGHGSHVASTAVGNRLNATLQLSTGAVTRSLSGVAPHANLIAYKACEETEDCRFSWLLAAINQAVADGVDVINYSIGGPTSDPWTTTDAVAMLNAREAGVVVVVAGGNEGPRDATMSSPGDAPWVISAANSTHDRAIVNRLVDLSGGATAPPAGGVLLGVGSTAGYGPASIVVPLDFPGCSIGSDIDSPPSGISNPWTTRVFNGEIVVCARGTQARVAKSNNVRLAGGGGMVLTNTALEGESVIADEHSIPSTHVGFEAATALRQWLSSGSGHRGRIEGAQVRSEPQVADLLASSSSRGPSGVAGILKPNVAAPGTAVLAAAGTGSGFAFLTGTSMATPHVAGAAALLLSAHPTWSVSDVESSLSTTALPVVRSSDGTRTADPFEQGGGRIDVPSALRAGLGFPLSTQALRDARPALGGQPRTLNQPALVDPRCLQRCSFARVVNDLAGGGRWRVEAELPDGATATVTPAEFDLAAGASQSLQIAVDVSDPKLAGQWVSGALVLRRIGGAPASDARITVHVFAFPGLLPEVSLVSPAERSVMDVSLSLSIDLPDLHVAATSIVPAQLRRETMFQDPTNDDPYDSFGNGSFFALVTVPASTAIDGFRLDAMVRSATAQDVDLFVGLDVDGDGLPDASEEVCVSALPAASESCSLAIDAIAAPQSYWVLVQNFRASGGGSDVVDLRTSLVELKADPASALTVTAPATVPAAQTIPMRLALDAPTSAPDSLLVGYVALSAVADAPRPLGWMRVEFERGSDPLSARALVPGRTQTLRLEAGAAAEGLFVDVPANASTLTLSSSGAGQFDIYAARVATPSTPVIAPAPPREQAVASATGPGGNHSLVISGETLAPGRWYLTPVNTGPFAAIVNVKADLTYVGARAQPRFGAYFDPARDGSGLFLFPVGDTWGLAWYTYLEDRTPTWYLGAAPRPAASQGQWVVDLLRYRWNGSAAIGTKVGEALLSLNQELAFTFSWSLDSRSGSQAVQWIGDTRCPVAAGANLDVNGLWFSPDKPGFGYSVVAGADFESIGAYYYDAKGSSRWVLGQVSPFGVTNYPLVYRTGSCPLCTYAAPVSQTAPAGTIWRDYGGPAMGRIRTEILVMPQLLAPAPGDWRVDFPVVKLSDATGCE
jgi:subtilisin family serine protease